MKKEIMTGITVLVILFCVMHFVAIAHGAERELQRNSKYYAHMAIVTEFDEETDMVILTDLVGNVWSFTGIEDWEVGDFVAMIMDRKGTMIIYDDKIVYTRYCGCVRKILEYFGK